MQLCLKLINMCAQSCVFSSAAFLVVFYYSVFNDSFISFNFYLTIWQLSRANTQQIKILIEQCLYLVWQLIGISPCTKMWR